MKFKYLIRSISFLSSLLIITFISISNQKEYTRLRILIWNTPKLTLGTYLALSSGTGFLISYIITTKLSIVNSKITGQSLRYKLEDNYEENNLYTEKQSTPTYENILIERDIKDPSPTINASFRILSKTDSSNTFNLNNNKPQYDGSFAFEDQSEEQSDKNDFVSQEKSITSDWNDQSYSVW
tara:strand:+ start:7472 stop:8017 length:546 start_codon:yes stop_codon:yes gene_type:complete